VQRECCPDRGDVRGLVVTKDQHDEKPAQAAILMVARGSLAMADFRLA
jgi:hypothetical protein